MMSFRYRDLRQALVAKAIAQLGDLSKPGKLSEKLPKGGFGQRFPDLAARAALSALRKEDKGLKGDRYEASDGFVALLAADWIVRHRLGLAAAAANDVAFTVLKQKPLVSGVALQRLLLRPAQPSAAFFARVVKAVGDEAAAELAGIALGEWVGTEPQLRNYPLRDVGVMLPLRLETVFKQTEGGWRLLLRVTPDEPSILRDNKQVSAVEAELLGEFWARSTAMDMSGNPPAVQWLDDDHGAIAWRELCDAIGAPRAAWLVAEFPPVLTEGVFVCAVPPDRIGESTESRVSGLPPELIVTAFDKAGDRYDLAVLKPQQDGIDLSLPTEAGDKANWLTDWDAAKSVGLGVETDLPDGLGPDTILSLYVYGLGDEKAGAHFSAQAQSGVMGILKPGMPTNTVEGGQAADLGKDGEAWRGIASLRMQDVRQAGTEAMAEALCGDGKAVDAIPGGNHTTEESRRLVQVLWPALWGHGLRDVWTLRDRAHELWDWANQWLAPEGPLPPLRFDSQPYGVLPVVSLNRIESEGSFVSSAEERIVQGVLHLLPQWEQAAQTRGTVVEADEERLLDLLARTGVSSNYDYRTYVSAETLAQFYNDVPYGEFMDAAMKAWSPAIDVIGERPAKPYIGVWNARPLHLPLIGAERMPAEPLEDAFERLYRDVRTNHFADAFFMPEKDAPIIPDSLLIRLMIWSGVLAKAWYNQSVDGPDGLLINPDGWNAQSVVSVEAEQKNFQFHFEQGAGAEPAAGLVKNHFYQLLDLAGDLGQYREEMKDPENPGIPYSRMTIPEERKAELERAFRATLDTASHRIDPWATGVAMSRLAEQAGSGKANHRLGAYGWLEGPFLGKPGPNASGRLHAPSYDQALTSIILRDKYLADMDQPGENKWSTMLDSASVRVALGFARDIRSGFHIFEALGRRVEEIVEGRDQILRLRDVKPMRPERPDRRDVCQGLQALAGLLDGSVTDVLSVDAARNAEQIERLRALDAGLDAFADLLVAEGVYNVVGGQAALAADPMDAAAGFARPPEFDVVSTPPSGYRLTTSTVAVMPYVSPKISGSPLEQADASLAAFLAETFGALPLWNFHAEWSEGGTQQSAEVALGVFGLTPLEAALVPEDFLAEMVRDRLGQPTAAVAQPQGHRLMRQMAGAFGTQPALADDISAVRDEAADQAIDGLIQEDMLKRYLVLNEAFSKLADTGAGGDAAAKVVFLRTALCWGVVGSPEPASRKALIGALFQDEMPEDAVLDALVEAAVSGLKARLKAAPDPADPKTASLSAAALARAIGDLTVPGGRLSVTAHWTVAQFKDRTGLRDAEEPTLDTEWLPVVAPLRPALARIEAVQLEGGLLGTFSPLKAWSAAPAGDPWRLQMVEANSDARNLDLTQLDMSRLVHAYGGPDAFEDESVAVALIDQFSEGVPMPRRTTFAAFGFNAPASRAPQAILLAAPPRSDKRLENDDVLDILIQTRQLAHARAARPEHGAAHPVMPAMWFQASGPFRVRLDTGTQYTR